jgi:hypothetical protein
MSSTDRCLMPSSFTSGAVLSFSQGPADALPAPMLTRVFAILLWLAFSVMAKIAASAGHSRSI